MKEVFRIVNQNNIIVWLCNHIAKAAVILMLGLQPFAMRMAATADFHRIRK